jgi:hypothetical protein
MQTSSMPACTEYQIKNYQVCYIAECWHVERTAWQLTYLLTPWCRVLLEKLTGLQLVKKFPAHYGTQRFITALTSVRHLSLSWASPIQSTSPFVFCAMLPLETLPPSDPSGGVVYLQIVLSPEEASYMRVFLNRTALQGGVVSPSPNPPSWRTTPCRLSTTAYSIYSQLPSILEVVPLSTTWGRAIVWFYDSFNTKPHHCQIHFF